MNCTAAKYGSSTSKNTGLAPRSNWIAFFIEFSKAQVAFAGALGNFSFQTIGEQTEDEKMIGE